MTLHAEWSFIIVAIFPSRFTAIAYAVDAATINASTKGIHAGDLPTIVAAAPEDKKKEIPVIHCFCRV
jgi:hypothetical protein